MRKRALLASLVLIPLALASPAAHADDPSFGCEVRSVHQEALTGQNFEGVVAGYVIHALSGPVGIRCAIRVNGDDVSQISGAGSDAFALGQGPVSFAAGETDTVELVAEATTSHGTSTYVESYNPYAQQPQVPPQEVYDLIDQVVYDIQAVWYEYMDPWVCPVLAPLSGGYGPVRIDDQGDVYVEGVLVQDCPPYDVDPPGGDPAPDPTVGADADGYYVAAGDEESGSIGHNDISTNPTHRSSHQHDSSAMCGFYRRGQSVRVAGWMTLGAHAGGHQYTELNCELWAGGSLISSSTFSSASGNVAGRFTLTSSASRHTVCYSATGIWTDGDQIIRSRRCRTG